MPNQISPVNVTSLGPGTGRDFYEVTGRHEGFDFRVTLWIEPSRLVLEDVLLSKAGRPIYSREDVYLAEIWPPRPSYEEDILRLAAEAAGNHAGVWPIPVEPTLWGCLTTS